MKVRSLISFSILSNAIEADRIRFKTFSEFLKEKRVVSEIKETPCSVANDVLRHM